MKSQKKTTSPVSLPPSPAAARTHAVVLGGSLAGVAAAGVLSRYFDKVTLVERDAYPTEAVHRAGVPQARHAHGLLQAGAQTLEQIFPGFRARMIELGAHDVDYGTEMIIRGELGWAPRKPGVRGLISSRALIDFVSLESLRRIPSVEIRERTEAVRMRIEGSGPKARVTGVELRHRETGERMEVAADLVVDTCGRGSKTLDWLEAMGFARPDETVVDPHAGYSSRWFQAPAGFGVGQGRWWKGGIIQSTPLAPDTMALMLPVEGNRWVVSIARCGANTPSDEEGFMKALRELPSPFIADAVAVSEPISPIYCHRGAANRFRHYERWEAWLAGFVALGDAVCAFNPVYGQGMTAAVKCAGILEEVLRATGPLSADLPRRFFRAQARWLVNPWSLATGADLRFATTTGKRPVAGKLLSPYFRAVFTATLRDERVRARMIEVMNLLAPVTTLFSPSIAARVLWDCAVRLYAEKTDARPVPALPALDEALAA